MRIPCITKSENWKMPWAWENACEIPRGRYDAGMTGISLARSSLAGILRQKQLTVADLLRRIDQMGVTLDKKTVYRLTRSEPIRTLNLPVVAAVSHALELADPSELLEWSVAAGPPRLQRIDEATQARLDELMDRNTEGSLNAAERREFEKLGELVEKLSLENASLLVQQTRLNEEPHRYRTGAKAPPGRRKAKAAKG
jgi:hypothetical protein